MSSNGGGTGGIEFEDIKEKCGGFCSKFFSLIVAALLDILTTIYTGFAGRLISNVQSISSAGFAHFLAMILTIMSALLYTALHFVPKRAYRLLYLITATQILAIFLMSHSMGLTAPTVDDCNEYGFLNATLYIGNEFKNVGQLSFTIVQGENGLKVTQAFGRLGQPLGDCTDFVVVFVTSFLILLLLLVAIFDTQRMLLTRVRSKTYGERFVEMGIK